MKKLLLFFSAVCCLLTANLNGQLVDVFHSVVATGPIGGIPAGYSTYRIYARMQDPTDRISSVFGSTTPSPVHHLRLHSSSAGNVIWNSGFAGSLGSDNNCAFWGFFADMQWDSYVSIGATSSATDACPDCAGTQGTIFQITNPAGQIPGTFAAAPFGPDLTITDGAWFIPNDGSCNGFGQAPDNRILIAQVTMPTGTLEYWMNIAVFNESVGANQLIYVHTQQGAPGLVGTIPEIDGNCLGLVFPEPAACNDVPGCTNATACNFNPLATTDDGSCTFPGCTNPAACNYNATAGCDNGSCTFPGCTNPTACNFEPTAGCDNGSCIFPGCTNPAACNFDPTAGCDNGSCTFPGCTNPAACNYSATAGCDNGSCTFPGCTNPAACNFDPTAGCDNGSCILPDGCTNAAACNYNPAAVCDDGSCVFSQPQAGNCDATGYADLGGPCAASVCAGDAFCCNVAWDSICALAAATDPNCAYCQTPIGPGGCTNPAACNFDALACSDDGSCDLPDGCTDSNACNYDSSATCDDGSCVYASIVGLACNQTNYTDLSGPCAASVCAGDSFCCNVAWDSICALAAATNPNCAYCQASNFPLAILGCTDANACNYNPAAQCDDGSCIPLIASPGVNCNEVGYADLSGPCAASVCSSDSFCCNVSWDGLCASSAALDANCAYCLTTASGCTNPAACNYNNLAGCDDGSCTFPGCTNPSACNYNAAAGCDDGSCILPDGCTDSNACNFDPSATCNDGSCVYASIVGLACNQTNYTDLSGPCAASVCAGDSFCCNVSWDGLCASAAATNPNCAYCQASNFTLAILGCTDATACNYNVAAQCDDGSCTYPGCNDAAACNYNAVAGCDDGSCIFPGCTDMAACNYNPTAGCDDGSCTFPGCTDMAACNYNPSAGCDDGSCTFPGCTDMAACNYNPSAGCDDGSCTFPGCTDMAACNYNPTAGCDDGSCTFPGCTDAAACNYNPTAGCDDGSCTFPGCTDAAACNYNAGAGCDDGSCTFPGCNNAAACNYNAGAGCDDGSCTFPGCTDPSANNYNPAAGCDDGSCTFDVLGCTDATACNYNAVANVDDGSCTYPGCTNATACNYDATAACDDGSCDFSCYGCTDATACNFDAGATIDDGSCTYAPCVINDTPGGAIALPITQLGSCSLTSVDLSGSSDSPQSQGSGSDLWYSFVAVTSGARIEVYDVSGQNVQIELFDTGLNSVSYENVVSGNGNEILNVGNLVPGNTYILSVSGSGLVNMCLQWIPDTGCNYGPGPYNLCSTFKALWVGANGYTFYFTSTTTNITYSKFQSSPTPGTFVLLSTVPGLTWGDTYSVSISANWTLTNGAGTESVEVLTDSPCPVIVNPQPLMELRASDRCANGPRLLGSSIAGTPFVCASIDFQWEFTRTDVPELPFTHLRGAANRFLTLSTVPGLVPGATYDVRVRPIFASGPGVYGAAHCMSIVGPTGAAEEVVSNPFAQDERLDVVETTPMIYPNPNTGEFVNLNLDGIESETVRVRIMDGVGKVVFDRTYAVEGSLLKEITFDNPLAAGSYTVNMIAGDMIRTEKMMVQR